MTALSDHVHASEATGAAANPLPATSNATYQKDAGFRGQALGSAHSKRLKVVSNNFPDLRSPQPEKARPVSISDKDYIDAKADATRAQNDARFSDVLSELRSMRADIDGKFAQVNARLDGLSVEVSATHRAADNALSAARAAETVARGAADTARAHNWNILMAMIATIGVVLAIAALWMTAMQTVRSLIG